MCSSDLGAPRPGGHGGGRHGADPRRRAGNGGGLVLVVNSSKNNIPLWEFPLGFSRGLHTAIQYLCGCTATMPPPTPGQQGGFTAGVRVQNACALRRDGSDGRGLLRPLSGLVRDGTDGALPFVWIRYFPLRNMCTFSPFLLLEDSDEFASYDLALHFRIRHSCKLI